MKTVNSIFCAICIVVASAAKIPSGYDFSEVKSAKLDPRIVNGKNAEEGQFPYQVSLRSRYHFEHFCGASIIGSRFILSAGHCHQDLESKPGNFYAVIGTLLANRHDGVRVEFDRVLTHEEFSFPKNDITLLRTVKEIIFSDTIQPIALPSQILPAGGNVAVVASGWGQASNDPRDMPEHLQFTELHTISTDDCKNRMNDKNGTIITENLVCRLGEETGICQGDSGGPLADLATKTLVGIVSWTAGICAQGNPDGFTRVHPYLDWIHAKIEEQSDF